MTRCTSISLAVVSTVYALVGAGCGGAQSGASQSYMGSSGGGAYASTESTSTPPGGSVVYRQSAQGGGQAAPSRSAPAPSSASGGYGGNADVGGGYQTEGAPSVEPAPENRAGLATQWGEARQSALAYEPFVRAGAVPFATAAIHYNDAQGAMAQAYHRGGGTPVQYIGAYNNGVHVSIRDEGGSPLPGTIVQDQLYVIGAHGQRYSVVLENTTPLRLEAVVSVDGLDVMNGQPGDLSHRGYILRPYATVTVDGFRQNEQTVAAFRFGTVADSYAAQTGTARNVGVIGVALFNEQGVMIQSAPSHGEVQIRETANPFPGRFAAPPPVRYYP